MKTMQDKLENVILGVDPEAWLLAYGTPDQTAFYALVKSQKPGEIVAALGELMPEAEARIKLRADGVHVVDVSVDRDKVDRCVH